MAEKKYELIKESKITESREIGTDLSHLTKYNEYDKDRGEYVSYYKPEDIRKERKKLKEKRKALKKDECEYEDIFNTSNFVKPKLLEETYNLYRIRALKDFEDVMAGDLGGYIEKEENLFQEGNCWVSDEARVYDNAKVSGNARVYNDAKVFGNAQIYDNAGVFDDTEVYGNAKVYGKTEVSESAEVFGEAEIYGKAQIYNGAKVYKNAEETAGYVIQNNIENFDNSLSEKEFKEKINKEAYDYIDERITMAFAYCDKEDIIKEYINEFNINENDFNKKMENLSKEDKKEELDRLYELEIEKMSSKIVGQIDEVSPLGLGKSFSKEIYKYNENDFKFKDEVAKKQEELYDNYREKIVEKEVKNGFRENLDISKEELNDISYFQFSDEDIERLNKNYLEKNNLPNDEEYADKIYNQDNIKEYNPLSIIDEYPEIKAEVLERLPFDFGEVLPPFQVYNSNEMFYDSGTQELGETTETFMKSLVGEMAWDFMNVDNIIEWYQVAEEHPNTFKIVYFEKNDKGEYDDNSIKDFTCYNDYADYSEKAIKESLEDTLRHNPSLYKRIEENVIAVQKEAGVYQEKTFGDVKFHEIAVEKEEVKEKEVEQEINREDSKLQNLKDYLGNAVNIENEIEKFSDKMEVIVDKLDLIDKLPVFKVMTEEGILYSSDKGSVDFQDKDGNMVYEKTKIFDDIKNKMGEEFFNNMNMSDIRDWENFKNNSDITLVYDSYGEEGDYRLKEYSDFNSYAKETVKPFLVQEILKNPELGDILKEDIVKNDKVKENNKEIKEKEVAKDDREMDF